MIERTSESCRPLRADAARNRERILAAASEVFATRGLDATLDEVAHHAGVGVGTVYRRFPGKESLIEALFESAVNDMLDLAVEASDFTDSWEGLVWFLERFSERQAEDFGLRDVLMYGMCGSGQLVEARARIVPVVTSLVERAQRDGMLREDIVAADIPIIELMVNSVASHSCQTAPGLWRRYLTIILDGLCTQADRRTALPNAPTNNVAEAALCSLKLPLAEIPES